jgi:hypothetical protein
MFAIVPVNVIIASAIPSPAVKVRPLTPLSVSVPCVDESVTRTVPPPASMSPMLIKFPLPLENVSVASSLTDCGPGTEFTGASFTALTVIATLSVSESAPPSPVLP